MAETDDHKDDDRSPSDWNGMTIDYGETRDLHLHLGESFGGFTVEIPYHVTRGTEPGPTVLLTAAIHGDEINGTGTIRKLIIDPEYPMLRGTLVMVPVVNMFGFDRHSRYLPDRRDLNRCFPGNERGSLASRVAHTVFNQLVRRADYVIDLHTAAIRRTNYPNVRADLSSPETRELAEVSGCELLVDGRGPKGCFRREACRIGCPTIVLEAGEAWKVESSIVEVSVRCIRNILSHLKMIDATIESPTRQIVISRTRWMRADRGGFLQFHVAPGQVVEKDQPLVTNTNLLGYEQDVLYAPFNAVVLGMTTVPTVSPGEGVCLLGQIKKRDVAKMADDRAAEEDDLNERLRSELSTGIMVTDPSNESST